MLQTFIEPAGAQRYQSNQNSLLWQSASLNMDYYQVIFDEIATLALNRFRWINLPDSVDAEFLEYLLVFNGSASVAHPEGRTQFLATALATDAPLNIYRRPVRWRCIKDNGGRGFEASINTGAVCYDNQTRYPILQKISVYAQQLADIYITKRVNLYHQRIPMVLEVPQDKELDAINVMKQVGGGEPAILGYDSLSDLKYNALTTSPPTYIGKELVDAERAIWARVYDALGIPNVIFKGERQITTEVQAQQEETGVIRLDGLRERRKFANELNKRFYEPNALYPKLLDKPIFVVKSEDYESDLWNVAHAPDTEEKEQA